MQKKIILTHEGLSKLQDELEMLKTVKRREIAEKIKVALSFGDLTENSEYDEAKNEQGIVEARISEIETALMNAERLDAESLTTEEVQIGNKIKIKNLDKGNILDLQLVGSKEVDMKAGKISDESPIGKACMGHKKGDVVEAEAPAGTVKYEILEISK
ncbi:MAG: transcription elongation factor GreA [Oscillospiraceae bacterium]|jgi:transcription elongation factor GreA|nr:transcription elongation factor GreA [Oscillospiraceae bacterium]